MWRGHDTSALGSVTAKCGSHCFLTSSCRTLSCRRSATSSVASGRGRLCVTQRQGSAARLLLGRRPRALRDAMAKIYHAYATTDRRSRRIQEAAAQQCTMHAQETSDTAIQWLTGDMLVKDSWSSAARQIDGVESKAHATTVGLSLAECLTLPSPEGSGVQHTDP